jgi:competence protein ComGC
MPWKRRSVSTKIELLVVIGILALLLLAACVPTAYNQVNIPNAEGRVAGF